jgi:hypothetical protein
LPDVVAGLVLFRAAQGKSRGGSPPQLPGRRPLAPSDVPPGPAPGERHLRAWGWRPAARAAPPS